MIAAIEKDRVLHIVRSTGRVRLHVEVRTYCNLTFDAGSMLVLQVPDVVFTQGRTDPQGGVPCPKCRMGTISGYT